MRSWIQKRANQVIVATGVALATVTTAVVIGNGTTGGGGGGTPTPTATATATSTAAPSGLANVWVDTNGGSCGHASSLTSWVDSSGCGSLGEACDAANAGDTVRVKNGVYDSQTLATSCSGTSGSRITFDAEAGSSGCTGLKIVRVSVTSYTHNKCPVDFADLTVRGHDVTVKDFSTPDWIDIPQSTSDVTNRVTFTNAHSKGVSLNGSNILAEGGEVGGFYVCAPSNWDGSGWIDHDLVHIGFDVTNHVVDGITMDSYVFHDLYSRDGAEVNCGVGDPHPDCLQLASGNNIVIKNSEFYRCATSDIQSNSDFGPPYGNLSYINNVFGLVYDAGNCCEMGTTDPGGPQSDDCTGTNVFAYNTLRANAVSQVCSETGSFIFEGNIVADGDASVSWDTAGSSAPTIDYNVFSSGSMGTHSKTCTPSFVGSNDEFGGSLLSPTDTCASNAGKPGTTYTTDIQGGTRGNPPDAGADEIAVP